MKTRFIIPVVYISTYTLLAIAVYYVFYNQANTCSGLFPSDIPLLISIIKPYINGYYYIPHPMTYLIIHCLSSLTGVTYQIAAPIVMTTALLLTLYLVQKFLASTKNLPEQKIRLLPVSLSLLFVIAIYVPFFNKHMYIGQFSPNIWHSATTLLLKPFALLSFIYFVIFLKNGEQFSWSNYVIGSMCLLISTAVKPSFVITFLPAVGLYLFLHRCKDSRLYTRVVLWSLPSIVLLAFQYLQTYQSKGTPSYFHDKIILTNFGVMKLYTPSITISVMLVLAFPLAVAIVGRRRVFDNLFLKLAWIVTILAFLQVAFLAEQQKFSQCAFGFGYVMALFLLYVFSMNEYLEWFRNKELVPGIVGKGIVSATYLLHMISGIYYFTVVIRGGSYL